MKVLLLLLMFASCSLFPAKKADLEIKSQPEGASVLLTQADGKQVELGTTPLKLSFDANEVKSAKRDGLLSFTITKAGFVPQKILLDTSTRKQVELEVTMVELATWTNPDSETASQHAERLIGKIQQVNRLMSQRQLPEALDKIDVLIAQYPKASVLFSMKGSLQLLLGQKQAAIASYQQCLAINKDNVEAKKMLEKLQGGSP